MPQAQQVIEEIQQEALEYNRVYIGGVHKDLGQDELERFVERATSIEGVHEVSVYEIDRVAYLKVEKGFDDTKLQALLTR